MSLFGSSPENESPAALATPTKDRGARPSGLFSDDAPRQKSSGSLFDNNDDGDDSPWAMPTPRKQQSRAEVVRNLLPSSDVPDAYIEIFDIAAEGGRMVSADGVARVFTAAGIKDQATKTRIVSVVSPDASGDEVRLQRAEFNVLLALVGLSQEGEAISLDGVDERRRSKCRCLFSWSDLSSHVPRVALSFIAPGAQYWPTYLMTGHSNQSLRGTVSGVTLA